jgi:hypothetical protein
MDGTSLLSANNLKRLKIKLSYVLVIGAGFN